MKSSPKFSLSATAAALALVSLASPARAQIEGRCPTGWSALPTPPPGEGERMIVACARPPMQIVATQLQRVIAPNDPTERAMADQLAASLGEGGAMTASPFRTETIGTFSARVTDLTGPTTPTRVEGTLVLLPAGASTVMVMGLSSDAAQGNVRPVVRTLIPTFIGLDGGPAVFHATASCPAGLNPVPSEPMSGNGMRRVVRCASEAGQQLDVLESRLPMRSADEARATANQLHATMQRQLQQIGGTATMDATQPASFGTLRGFSTLVHASASDPRAPAGSPGAAIRIEALVTVLPTPTGHVHVVAVDQSGDTSALVDRVRAFVTGQLRVDGPPVQIAATVPAAPGPPGGAAPGAPPGEPGASSPAASSRRPPRREVDLSQPLWDPGPVDRPHATTPAPTSSGKCGCSTPGHAPANSALLVSALTVLAVARTRRRGTRR